MNAGTKRPKYGGFQFKGEGFEFYKFPEPGSFNFNNMLIRMRADKGLRARFMSDPAAVGAECSIRPEQADALASLKIERVSGTGGHPIIGWTVILLLQMDKRIAAGEQAAGGH
jgi:hypothetical protein